MVSALRWLTKAADGPAWNEEILGVLKSTSEHATVEAALLRNRHQFEDVRQQVSVIMPEVSIVMMCPDTLTIVWESSEFVMTGGRCVQSP